jgi:putative serine protease PepD
VRRPARLAGAISAAVVLSAAGVALAAGLIDTGGDSSSNSAAALAPAGGGRVPEGTIGRVYAAAGPSVVAVQANQDGGTASGTGFVVDGRGTIITNSHVVGSARNARVRFGERPPIQAEVLGTDPSSDLAALRIDPARAGNPKPLALANSRDVAVGDQVVAIGHPFGLDRTATAGIVSGLERQIEAPNGFSIDEVIQTDAPINPGNSGGPLLDAKGRVIGVNSQIAASAGGGGNVGIGFAVPSDTVREVLPTLARGEQVERAYLGLTTSAAARGAAVENVTAGGPAARGGMRRSDTVTSVAGRTVRDPDDVAKAIADRKPGDTIEVDVVRGGRTVSLDVTLGERPAQRAP